MLVYNELAPREFFMQHIYIWKSSQLHLELLLHQCLGVEWLEAYGDPGPPVHPDRVPGFISPNLTASFNAHIETPK